MNLKKKGKKTKLSTLKKKAWSTLSLLTRLSASDANGYCSCVTCGMTKHYKEMQAGHWVPQAQGNAVRFDRRNVHVQCYRCNVNLGGNGPEYSAFMERTYGKEVMEELRRKSNESVKFTQADYEQMISEWESELQQLDAA